VTCSTECGQRELDHQYTYQELDVLPIQAVFFLWWRVVSIWYLDLAIKFSVGWQKYCGIEDLLKSFFEGFYIKFVDFVIYFLVSQVVLYTIRSFNQRDREASV
jgi:hypothetical protein